MKKKAILQSLMAHQNGAMAAQNGGSMCPPSSPPPSLLSRLWSSLRLQRSKRPVIPSSSKTLMIQRTQSERRIVSNGNNNQSNNGCIIKERPKQLQPSIRSKDLKDNNGSLRGSSRRPLAAQELHNNHHLGNKFHENGQASPILSRPRTPKPAPRFSLNNSLTTTTTTGSKPNNLRSKRHRPGYRLHTLGVKVRNMKMDFNTRGTWRRVGQ